MGLHRLSSGGGGVRAVRSARLQNRAKGTQPISSARCRWADGHRGADCVSSYWRGNRLASNDRTDASLYILRPFKSGSFSRHDWNSCQHRELSSESISWSISESTCFPCASCLTMRLIFAGGGTGGHLYPGLAIARALKRADHGVEPFFIGAQRGIERDVLPQVGFAFELLDLHPLYRSRPWENWKTFRGAMTAWRMIGAEMRSEPPVCVVGTGGYASGLALAYAVAHRIPYVLQEQNTHPGITARFFSRYAAQIHLGFPEARRHLSPGKSTEVFDSGNPIDPPPPDAFDKTAARVKWGFPSTGGRVLLVYGGSQGSQAMNEVVSRWIERGLPRDLFVIWATGKANYEKLSHYASSQVKVRAYIAPISEAYRAADFALSRAGAIATAELCAWGIPAIVVPLPTAAADHQTANARALSAAGAAEMIRQSEMTVDSLSGAWISVLRDPDKLTRMREKALERARPTAAADIAREILRLISNTKR